MNKTIKGRMNIEGVQVEFEGESAETLAEVVTAVLGTSPEAKEKALKAKRAAYQRELYHKNKNQGTSTSATKVHGNTGRKNKNTHGYHKWSENDVVAIAKLAIDHGEDKSGFGSRVYHYLRAQGDVTTRGKSNVIVFANRIHRYLYLGQNNGDLNENIVEFLSGNGYRPKTEESTGFLGNFGRTRSPEQA